MQKILKIYLKKINLSSLLRLKKFAPYISAAIIFLVYNVCIYFHLERHNNIKEQLLMRSIMQNINAFLIHDLENALVSRISDRRFVLFSDFAEEEKNDIIGKLANRDVMTQTTLSMLRESEIPTQTENETKEISVQVSSSMASASMQTESVPISTSFAQTESSTIGATEIATQTHIVSSDQEVQTPPLKLSDSFSQTESRQEQVKQTEIGTSTDDLYELETLFDSKRIEDWDAESQSGIETNSWDSASEVSIASSSKTDTEAEQSDVSTQTDDDASLALTQQSLK